MVNANPVVLTTLRLQGKRCEDGSVHLKSSSFCPVSPLSFCAVSTSPKTAGPHCSTKRTLLLLRLVSCFFYFHTTWINSDLLVPQKIKRTVYFARAPAALAALPLSSLCARLPGPAVVGWTEEWPRGLAGSTRMSVAGGGAGRRALQASILSHLLGNSSDVKCAEPL